MPKDYLADYSATAGSNTDIGGVDIDEGCAPSTLNDAIRECMSHLAAYKTQTIQGAAVASATALPVNVAGVAHSVTGTTTVTSLADPTNDTSNVKILTFAGILTLTNGASLILPGGANITTAAGDTSIWVYEGSSVWRCIYYPELLLDEDDLVSDSATQAATQQSIKAYVDNSSSKIVQVVNTQTGAVSTGTTTLPLDDTIPQNTEGTEFMTLAITPTSASNLLKIEFGGLLTNNTSVQWCAAALFQDSTVGALAVGAHIMETGTRGGMVNFTHYMTAGTASETTFKIRAGAQQAGTTTFNGSNGTRVYGGVVASSLTITEIAA